MDGDGQHLPEEIERLVKPILKNEADIVIGSRVLGQREKDSSIRWIGIRVFNFIINMLTGARITDCTNGFRAFRVSALEKIVLHQEQFHTAELIIDAARKGIRIDEVPVTVLRRHYGESKKGRNIAYGLNFYKTILKTWLRK
jgi:glycosyltransferase involved in cell wall biosynthesis